MLPLSTITSIAQPASSSGDAPNTLTESSNEVGEVLDVFEDVSAESFEELLFEDVQTVPPNPIATPVTPVTPSVDQANATEVFSDDIGGMQLDSSSADPAGSTSLKDSTASQPLATPTVEGDPIALNPSMESSVAKPTPVDNPVSKSTGVSKIQQVDVIGPAALGQQLNPPTVQADDTSPVDLAQAQIQTIRPQEKQETPRATVPRQPELPAEHSQQTIQPTSQTTLTPNSEDPLANQPTQEALDAAPDTPTPGEPLKTPAPSEPAEEGLAKETPAPSAVDNNFAPVVESSPAANSQLSNSPIDVSAGSNASLVVPTQDVGAGAQPLDDASSVSKASIAEQVSNHIVASKISQKGESRQLEIRLDPPELGSISIEIVETNDRLSAKVSATEPIALQALQSNLSHLFDSLDQAGVEFDKLEFAQHQDGNQQHEDRQSRTEDGIGHYTTDSNSESGTETNKAPVATDRRLDITV